MITIFTFFFLLLFPFLMVLLLRRFVLLNRWLRTLALREGTISHVEAFSVLFGVEGLMF